MVEGRDGNREEAQQPDEEREEHERFPVSVEECFVLDMHNREFSMEDGSKQRRETQESGSKTSSNFDGYGMYGIGVRGMGNDCMSFMFPDIGQNSDGSILREMLRKMGEEMMGIRAQRMGLGCCPVFLVIRCDEGKAHRGEM